MRPAASSAEVHGTSPAYILVADASHVDAAWQVVNACRAALLERGIDQWDDVYPTRDTLAEDAEHRRLYVLLSDAHCVATIALDDVQAAEYATVEWEYAAPALVIHRLCVDPMHQGRGFARTLMDFAEAHALSHGYGCVRLDSYSPNLEANSLYRRRGYREAGTVHFPRRTAPFYCFEYALGS